MTVRPRPRIAIVVSHPIQHFCPAYASFAKNPEWEVKVFFASKAGLVRAWDHEFGSAIKWEGLDLSFPHHFLNGELAEPSGSRLDAPGLASALGSFSPNALIVYGYSQALQKRAISLAHRAGWLLLMIADSETRYAQPVYKKLAKRLVLRSIYSKFSGFLTVGSSNEEHYRQHGVADGRLFRCPFPIDIGRYSAVWNSAPMVRTQLRQRFGIASTEIVVGVVAKLIPRKRQEDLLRAVSMIHTPGVKFRVLVIGTGPDEDALRASAAQIAQHSTVFAGFVQPADLAAFYASMDLYVHPATEDHHPLAISEAIFMGLPIVTTHLVGSYGPSDDLQPGRNGFVYEAGNVRQLAEILGRLGSDHVLRMKMSAQSRVIAENSQSAAHGNGLAWALEALGAGSLG